MFIDEGHRGASGDSWKKLRDKLSEAGFCFEYSATFGQSIAAEGNKKSVTNCFGSMVWLHYSIIAISIL